jgi:hypothetical protein
MSKNNDYEEARMDEWNEFLRTDKMYTAPDFLMQKFILKTGKLPPKSVMRQLLNIYEGEEE